MLKRVGWTAAAVGAAAVLRKRLSEQGLDPVGNPRLMEAHASQTEASYLAASTRVLVLGANFGGLATALELDRLTRGRRTSASWWLTGITASFYATTVARRRGTR